MPCVSTVSVTCESVPVCTSSVISLSPARPLCALVSVVQFLISPVSCSSLCSTATGALYTKHEVTYAPKLGPSMPTCMCIWGDDRRGRPDTTGHSAQHLASCFSSSCAPTHRHGSALIVFAPFFFQTPWGAVGGGPTAHSPHVKCSGTLSRPAFRGVPAPARGPGESQQAKGGP